MVVHLRKVQVLVDGIEETANACYWVTDGIDCCHVGFLMRHMVPHAVRYDGALAQLTKVFSDNEDIRNPLFAVHKLKYYWEVFNSYLARTIKDVSCNIHFWVATRS